MKEEKTEAQLFAEALLYRGGDQIINYAEQLRILRRCRFPMASFDKRFTRDMNWRLDTNPTYKVSAKQAEQIRRLMHRYRRQIGGLK